MRKIEKYLGNLFLKLLKLSITPEQTTKESFGESAVKNILIIIRHQMGDMLCATPMLRAVREYYPDAFITLVTKDSTNYQKVFANNSFVSECINFEYGFENFISLIKLLREKKYELAIVPSTVVFSATNHLIAYYSKTKYRAGVSSINSLENKTEFLLNIKKDFLWSS
ncbi:MAG: glycosyltransferase family 9 protein, partial [Ignavibacteria bacterium]